MKKIIGLFLFAFLYFGSHSQPARSLHWSEEGDSYYLYTNEAIVKKDLKTNQETILATRAELTPTGTQKPLTVKNFFLHDNYSKVLIYTNSKRVWRYETRGDYWLLDKSKNQLTQIGKTLPPSSLMFAKIAPNGKKIAYVSGHNIYVEDLESHQITALTTNGNERVINGTFDWVYEEELSARDGFRWSPDSKKIAYWNVDASDIRNFLMINNTDSIYSFNVPVEYPKVGYPPSPVKIASVDIATTKTVWIQVPGDKANNYLPRMEWAANNEIVIQQLNRKQNHSKLYLANTTTGSAKVFYEESNDSWIDIKPRWHNDDPVGWDWLAGMKEFLWMSEKDGWRHLYKVSKTGRETLITKGNFDVIDMLAVNEQEGYVYYLASPENATQQYLYRTKLTGNSRPEKLSPADQMGTHNYDISPSGKYAQQRFSNINTYSQVRLVSLPNHKYLDAKETDKPVSHPDQVKLIKIRTADNVEMDASVLYPKNFDSTKKYPVLFYVYTEPAGATVKDAFGSGRPNLYNGDFSGDGYFYISIDSRGTPAPKGAAWRKSIYKKVGILNIHDQAAAAREILKWHFIDTSRVAVWGWSGGGSTTLNLMFQHPDIYKTGIAVAAVANRLTYDNIYEERYMGLPKENPAAYKQASAITHTKGLQGNLLVIHGTGDDNVHYQNAEMLLNELIKNNKVFQFMAYPNRSHSISEGEGTGAHLKNIFTTFLKQNCPPGAR